MATETTTHYHVIIGTEERCATVREAFHALKAQSHRGVTDKRGEGRDTIWTLADGGTMVLRPVAAHS